MLFLSSPSYSSAGNVRLYVIYARECTVHDVCVFFSKKSHELLIPLQQYDNGGSDSNLEEVVQNRCAFSSQTLAFTHRAGSLQDYMHY